MNERSSRSHSLFMITIEQKNLDDGSTKARTNIHQLAMYTLRNIPVHSDIDR